MIVILGILLIVSLILAVRSMHDVGLPNDVKKLTGKKTKKGTIVFMKQSNKHYHS